MTSSKKTRKIVGEIINLSNDPLSGIELSTSKTDYALLTEVVSLLVEKENMTGKRAKRIIKDADAIVAYVAMSKIL